MFLVPLRKPEYGGGRDIYVIRCSIKCSTALGADVLFSALSQYGLFIMKWDPTAVSAYRCQSYPCTQQGHQAHVKVQKQLSDNSNC